MIRNDPCCVKQRRALKILHLTYFLKKNDFVVDFDCSKSKVIFEQ